MRALIKVSHHSRRTITYRRQTIGICPTLHYLRLSQNRIKMKKARLLIIALAGLAAAIPLAAGPKIVGGPFTVGVTQRTATMVWIVQSDEMTLRSETGTATLTSPSLRVERTTFTGLQPNTRYEYVIPDAGDASTRSFKTTPPSGAP